MGDGKGAWFKDSEGNLIAISDRIAAARTESNRAAATNGR